VCQPGGPAYRLVEAFDLFLPAATEHLGSPHGSGVVERVFVYTAVPVYPFWRVLVTIGNDTGTNSIKSMFR